MKTKTWLKGLVVAAVVSGGAAWAGESPWSLRLGVSYRDFDSVDFKGGGFRNLGAQSNTVGPYGVQNIAAAPGNPIAAPVILDYVNGGGGSEGFKTADKMAPVIGFRYDLKPVGNLKLALVGNFQYYNLNVDTRGGNLAVEQYQHYVLDAAGTLSPGAILVGPAFPGTTVAVRNRFDMDLYVLDLGIEGRLAVKSFNFTLALGPSLTIANADFTQGQQASWIAQGPGLPAGSYTNQSANESELKFLPGAYAAVGVTYDFSKSWALGLEYRYDYVIDNAGTDHAKLDLSGSSAILSLTYRF